MVLRYLLLFTSCFGFSSVEAQQDEVWSKEGLKNFLSTQNDTVYVLNFWATWCKPCIEELPEFKAAQTQFGASPVRFVFVSLDFMSKRENTLLPFIAKNMSWAEVVQLNAGNPNDWIPLVDPSWSGAIPATLFWLNKNRVFKEEPLHQPQIHTIIQTLLP